MSRIGVKSIKGFRDVLPGKSGLWGFVEETAVRVFALYGFSRIRTPIVEFSDIYKRVIGDSTDIVEKEMYSFQDRDGSEITLRPEGTAGVARAFIENSMHRSARVQKLYYLGEMFRHERPQRGRMREFHQIGAEFFGSSSASADCETMAMLWHFFREAGLSGKVEIELNSMGTPGDRSSFKRALTDVLMPLRGVLCDDCKKRVERNPLRIVDCKERGCASVTKNVPTMAEFLSPESSDHFEEVKRGLCAVSVPFIVNERIVRGLDYYTHTVFEVRAKEGLGAQDAIAAGGRYDLLVEALGGPPTPATGFAIGVERAVMLLEGKGDKHDGNGPEVFVGWVGGSCFEDAFLLSASLRERGVKTWIEHSEYSLRSQMKKADKSGAGYMVIMGPDEIGKQAVKFRNMKTGREKEFPLDRAADGISETVRSAKN